MEEITEKPFFALEEQLARQKGILANSNLLGKLPDRGQKLRVSVAKIEAELERRKQETVIVQQTRGGMPDVEKLEWSLKTTSLNLPLSKSEDDGGQSDIDSDDDDVMEEDDSTAEKNQESILKLIATSQITQRQSKPVIAVSSDQQRPPTKSCVPVMTKDVRPDPYLVKLVEKDLRKGAELESKFHPNKIGKKKLPGSSSPASSQESAASERSTSSKNKWDEALLPPKLDSEGVKMLSMEDTIKISCDKYNRAETMKAAAPPKKTYAYDKLRDEGLLGGYTVAMQTSRPVRTDIDEADFDEDDLSHDSITEESESEESDDDDKNKGAANSKQKKSKDLSKLLNTSLRLS